MHVLERLNELIKGKPTLFSCKQEKVEQLAQHFYAQLKHTFGHSSRIIQLKITGTKKTLMVGKELEIRKWLSKSHLYSSAFVVDHLEIENGIPQKFVLAGVGWGHGVGLCQIGAAVMSEKGYSYKANLNHYFRGAELKKLYQ